MARKYVFEQKLQEACKLISVLNMLNLLGIF